MNLTKLQGIGAIHQDEEGRFSLNDLCDKAIASGIAKDIRPNEWMALQNTKELAEILITEKPGSNPLVAKPGRYGGTYAAKELIYDYAMWISAEFHLRVIRAFDALAMGDVEKAQHIANPRRGEPTSLEKYRTQQAIKLAVSNSESIFTKFPKLGEEAKQSITAALVNLAAGQNVIPLARIEEKGLSATEIGAYLGVSRNLVGKVANSLGLKTTEYGIYVLGKAEHNGTQRETFLYNAKGKERISDYIMAMQGRIAA